VGEGGGGGGEGRGHEQVTIAFHDTGVNRQKRRTAAISNQGLIRMCRQFLDVYGTLNIVLHLDRKNTL